MIKFNETIKETTKPEKYLQANLHFSLVAGKLSTRVPAICNSYKPDVLVMSSGSSTFSSKHLSQQAAIKIIENVNSPILVVPEESEYMGVDNIPVLYVTDFLDSDHTSFRTLLTLLAPFNVPSINISIVPFTFALAITLCQVSLSYIPVWISSVLILIL